MASVLSVSLLLVVGVGAGWRPGEAALALPGHNTAPAPEARNGASIENELTLYIHDWDDARKSNLEVEKRRGLVVGRYDGCEIRAVYDCAVPEEYYYSYDAVSRKDNNQTRKIEEHINSVLFQRDRYRHESEQRRVRLIGVHSANRRRFSRDELQGECDGVTHIITRIHAGARGVDKDQQARDHQANGWHASETKSTQKGGDLEACVSASHGTPPGDCDEPMAVELVALAGEPLPSATCSRTSTGSTDSIGGLLPGQRPWKGLAVVGGLSLGASAVMATVGGFGVARSKALEAEHNDSCGLNADSDLCAELDRKGAAADGIQIAGLVAAPLLLGTGIALLVIAMKRKAHRSLALTPLLDTRTIGFLWKFKF